MDELFVECGIEEDETRPRCEVSVVLAAYNEIGCIKEELDKVRTALETSSFSYEIIVVDDGSDDGTARVVEEYNCEQVKLIRHRVNQGSGAARKTGTLAARGEFVVWSDVDLTYPNQRIPDLVNHLIHTEADQVVGARDSERGTMKILRVPTKYFIRKLACFLTGTYIPDLNSGLRAFQKPFVLKYRGILPKGFSFTTTITLAALTNSHSIEYLPIDYAARKGRSKIRPIRDTLGFLALIIKTVMYFNPLRVFYPMTWFVGLGFLASLGYDIFYESPANLGDKTVLLFVATMQILTLGLFADLICKRARL